MRSNNVSVVLVCAGLLAMVRAASAAPGLEQVMADPDWIGPPVEAAWWQLDGGSYVYRVKRPDSRVHDLYRMNLETGEAEKLSAAERASIDGPDPVFDRDGDRALMIRDENLFLRDLQTGTLRQLTGGTEAIANPAFSANGRHVLFRTGQSWWRYELERGVARPLAELRLEDAPHEPTDDGLEGDQLRLFETLERERRRLQELHEDTIAESEADPTRGPAPWYLGKGHEIVDSALSRDGRWLLAVVEKTEIGSGKQDRMPKFVTRSGYVEIEDVRTLVGRDPSTPQALWLLDLDQRERHEIDLQTLGGRATDPLAVLKKQQDIEPFDADNPRPVRITGIEWHPERARAAIQVRTIDNKDRWTVTVTAESQALTEIHRLNDPAWINWEFNEFGWVPESDRVWLLSEESGFSHLYTIDPRGEATQLTQGEFEVHDVLFSGDGAHVWMLSNRSHPTEYDLYRLEVASGTLTRLTELEGIEGYALNPRTGDFLLRHSDSYVPAQASVLTASGERRAAADTRTDAYRAIDWQRPEFVAVPSSHVDRPIWTKFYRARGGVEGPNPAVVFVHGAGYTQNSHHRFPYYFREQMFHNLLTERGYHVIDMDYRASRGYGRDWRTAIYRHMGKPELEDLIDGVKWLVENHDVDPERVGVYGGSYGGFMTFMAMFNAPDVFAAGAALRPVTDWAHYNHGYTSNILNTPQVDPEAYRRSSPIEFVENLEGHLLISHGMLDDNVFYKDSVRLVQRLIELEKQNWELASYPLEPHGYEHPESWLDQYRRILELFESTIGNQ